MKKQLAMMRDSIATAKTLSEALPYLQRYAGAEGLPAAKPITMPPTPTRPKARAKRKAGRR